jgi:PAS domain S-box-containing protein
VKRRAISTRHKHEERLSPENRRLSLDQIRQEWSWLREAMPEAEASRERYADLYDFAPVGYLTLDRNGCIREINLTGAMLLGRKRSQLMANPLLPLIEKQDRRKYLGHLSRLRRGQSQALTELAIAPKGGKPFIAQLVSVASSQNGAQAMQFRTALIDVGERKRADAALRESEERLRLALAGGRMGMWEMDLATGRAYLDGLGARLLGLDIVPKEFTNDQFLQLVHPEDRDELLQKIRHAAQAGGDFQCEFRLSPAPGGGAKWIAATGSVVRNELSQPTRLLGVSFDITQRKQDEVALRRTHNDLEQRVAARTDELARINQRLRVEISERQQAEAALRESERALADFFEHASIAIQWLDRRGRVLRINQAALELLGCSRAKCLHRPIAPFFADRQAFAEMLDRLERGERLKDFFVHLHRTDGSIRQLLIDADGSWQKQRLVHTRWFLRDISERVLLQAEIVAAGERERQRIGQDLHDGLCQLLTGIRWKSQSLQERLALRAPEEVRRVQKITRLLTDAIKQARGVVRGLQPVEDVPDGLVSALHQLASLTRDLFGVDCRFDLLRPVLVSEHGTATDLFRIAQEAVNNAIKHGRARKIRIELRQNKGNIVLTVTNDGRPFPRHSRTTGAGLKIMRHRARRIGATLQFCAGVRGGTSVTCSLPRPETGRAGDPFS